MTTPLSNEKSLSELQASIGQALPDQAVGYEAGYRDALQSLSLALVASGVPMLVLSDGVVTALDAYGNNAPDEDETPAAAGQKG